MNFFDGFSFLRSLNFNFIPIGGPRAISPSPEADVKVQTLAKKQYLGTNLPKQKKDTYTENY